jgi:CBS domain-containing protein
MRRSILTEKVARRGHHVMREYAVNPLALFRVEDVMHPPAAVVPADMRVDALFRRLLLDDPLLSRAQAWPLVSERGALVGILTRGDLSRVADAAPDAEPSALEAGTSRLTVAHPEELLEEAMTAMLSTGVKQLPVVSRKQPDQLLGMIDATAIAAAWSELRDDEHVREAGRVVAQLRLFRRKMRHLRRRAA